VPNPKTFVLPHGRGEVTVPSAENEAAHRRENLAMEKVAFAAGNGYPYEPTGDPLADGIGPGSWVPRADVPELDGHGHPKIVPMGQTEAYRVSAGRDPRGLPVMAGDGEIVGTVSDMWIDAPEQLVRYLEMELDADHGGGTRLVPMTFCKIGFQEGEDQLGLRKALRRGARDQVAEPDHETRGREDLRLLRRRHSLRLPGPDRSAALSGGSPDDDLRRRESDAA
jgi:photosynthetic reaction center subunit H